MKHTVDTFKQHGNIPVVGVDYTFLNKTNSGDLNTLVANDQKTHLFGIPVPRKKGVDEEEYCTRMLLR